ncbi:MAG: hypothetical protein M1831_000863 [Alyxoria varia]|nr:MAG: hypothetical protein M1831_000863 [Alyxoria varia]
MSDTGAHPHAGGQGGRQSPDPETQHPDQATQPPASNPNEQGATKSAEHQKEATEKGKHEGLASNPATNKIEEAAHDKVSKS